MYSSPNTLYFGQGVNGPCINGPVISSINLNTYTVTTIYTFPVGNTLRIDSLPGIYFSPQALCKDDLQANIFYAILTGFNIASTLAMGKILVSIDISTQIITYIAGNPYPFPPVTKDGYGMGASFESGETGGQICQVLNGVIYILDGNLNIVKQVFPSTNLSLTYIGNKSCSIVSSGYKTSACFTQSRGLSYISQLNIFVTGGFQDGSLSIFKGNNNGFMALTNGGRCSGYPYGATGFVSASYHPQFNSIVLGNSFSEVWKFTFDLAGINATYTPNPPPLPPWPPQTNTPPKPPSSPPPNPPAGRRMKR
jgi:hypothetical protein